MCSMTLVRWRGISLIQAAEIIKSYSADRQLLRDTKRGDGESCGDRQISCELIIAIPALYLHTHPASTIAVQFEASLQVRA